MSRTSSRGSADAGPRAGQRPLTAIRPARPSDVPAIVAMVHELAEYEKAPEQCHLTEEQLRAALFPTPAGSGRPSPRPALFGHVAVDDGDEPLGFALWFLNFSTWAGVHGIYLEDLYVRPAARGTGAGRRLLAALATICVERGYERLDWWMIHWNPARDFYRVIGAEPMDEWVPYRLTGPALRALAAGDRPAPPAPRTLAAGDGPAPAAHAVAAGDEPATGAR